MKTELKIDGMHCNSCAALIKEELEEIRGIETADVSLDDQRAIVEFDESLVKPEIIRETIQSLGYTTEV